LEYVDIGSIKEGDRIKWQFQSIGGIERPVLEARVGRIVGYGHSKHYDAPYIDFYEATATAVQRAIALPFIINHNGRRVDRQYWAGRLPGLDLLGQPSSNGNTRVVIGQPKLPLTEEDALALKTSTRKSLDEMSKSHREHIEKWEPFINLLGAEHVWASANRYAGRNGTGQVFVAVKRGAKDYAIVEFDTGKKVKAKVVQDGFENSKTLMDAFKEYRSQAKAEREASRPAKTTKASSGKKSSAKKPAAKKPAAKASAKKPVRKVAPKK
jgi:hypothetical protein